MMNKKQLLKVIMTMALMFMTYFYTGCKQKPSDDISSIITIGVSMSTFTSPYASATVKQFKEYATQKGYKLILLDSQLDIQREAYNIDNLMSRKVDTILVNVVDSKGSRAALKKAADAGFRVICFNSTVDKPDELGIKAYTGPEYYQQGVRAAIIAEQEKPNGKAVMITGTPGYSAANLREAGFVEMLEKIGSEITLLDIQTANWMREDAQRVMSDYITKYGDQLDIVYSQDDNMTAGAVNAMKAAGLTLENKPLVVSIGAMADGLPLIKEGWIDFSIMQSPKEDAQLAIDTAISILNGNQRESFKNYFLDTPAVDISNVQEVIDMKLWD
jgi:ribose transport system substrate-binding protein